MNRYHAAFCLVLVAACEKSSATGSSARGPELYAQLCSSCHGIEGKPTAMMIARLAVKDLTAPELRSRITPALVEYQIRKGSQNKLMPAFEGALIDEQIKAIADYVSSQQFLAPR